ncbi:putative uncharacterized protein [Roseburia sp. CAG:182]|nr:putative uncharacterized protein [Roseburia sp. CAG:182]
MKLDRIEFLFYILCCRDRAVRSMGNHLKSRCRHLNTVKMAHPADRCFRHSLKQNCIRCIMDFCLSVFSNLWCDDFSAEFVHHKLRTIAKSKYRNPKLKKFFLIRRRVLFVTAVWPSCQNDTLWIHSFDLLNVCFIRINLAINIAFSDSAGNQLVVLSAEIKYND